jgi:hypothetical protein
MSLGAPAVVMVATVVVVVVGGGGGRPHRSLGCLVVLVDESSSCWRGSRTSVVVVCQL